MRRLIPFCLVCFILLGCSTSEIVLRKLELTRPAIKDTVAADIITVNAFNSTHFDFAPHSGRQCDNENSVKDTVYRAVLLRKGSRADTAAIAEFNPKTRNFILEVPAIKDTILIYDTVKVNSTGLILRGNNTTERLIWIISIILTSIIIMIYKRYSNVRKSSKQA
ncbi:MAG TPA: hypothetical protein PKD67_10560 [Ignavibacteriaceae bacterium]|nr:hypothetical protein [Ignavibacteriaceae bacterium]